MNKQICLRNLHQILNQKFHLKTPERIQIKILPFEKFNPNSLLLMNIREQSKFVYSFSYFGRKYEYIRFEKFNIFKRFGIQYNVVYTPMKYADFIPNKQKKIPQGLLHKLSRCEKNGIMKLPCTSSLYEWV